MVATRLSGVVSKGYDWAATPGKSSGPASSSSSSEQQQPPPNNRPSDVENNNSSILSSYSSSVWNAASVSLSQAYSTLANAASSSYATAVGGDVTASHSSSDGDHSSLSTVSASSSHQTGADDMMSTNKWQSLASTAGRKLALGAPFHLRNPYNSVRGGRYAYNQQSSLSAVRSLLPLVVEDDESPFLTDISECSEEEKEESGHDVYPVESGESSLLHDQNNIHHNLQTPSPKFAATTAAAWNRPSSSRRSSCPYTPDPPLSLTAGGSIHTSSSTNNRLRKNSETATQLAEGTVRALRDIALDEAVEFHEALRFWSERYEHPLLSWLEAGPLVWFSKDGYNHQVIGRKVAQIQAVLARRCAGIGELQQHLLRAGWQRGVAQWGVLGQGGQWATINGTTVRTDQTAAVAERTSQRLSSYHGSQRQLRNVSIGESMDDLDGSSRHRHVLPSPQPLDKIGSHDYHRGGMPSWKKSRKDKKMRHGISTGYYASVFVRNEDDGKILMDDAALAEWSVDAMELIRNILVRASNGKRALPFEDNWRPLHDDVEAPTGGPPEQRLPQREASFDQESDTEDHREGYGKLPLREEEQPASFVDPHRQLPAWAQWAPKQSPAGEEEEHADDAHFGEEEVVISNLPLMAAEVSALLNSIEEIMPTQRHRRMRRLKPPSLFRRRWYLSALGASVISFTAYHLHQRGLGSKVIQVAVAKIARFFNDRVYEPTLAIIEEIWKGREGTSDKKARAEVIDGLKEMIRSWLNDNHPEIAPEERAKMAELMDITLIERKKAESMKTLFEINQAVRLSFIEMQFVKKEMLNAMYTMDELMSANDINMNLAAVTPAIFMVYAVKSVFKFCYYALLKIGKSREETYSSFRHTLTEMERLLVMRDNPPTSPFPQSHRRHGETDEDTVSQSHLISAEMSGRPNNNVLSADDLGMLMLHIHECRTILWRDYNRFSPAVIQNVSEDLAELAGERGAVSVQQQLQIIARMCRTYPFLKVISIGTTFHEKFIGAGPY